MMLKKKKMQDAQRSSESGGADGKKVSPSSLFRSRVRTACKVLESMATEP